MIASVRGVLVLVLLALGLGLVVLVDGRGGAYESRALLPDAESVYELAWVGTDIVLHHDGLTRDNEQGWTGDRLGEVDAGAVDAIVSTLRGARWHRRANRAAAGPVTTTLRVRMNEGSRVVELGVGAPLPGTEQVWLTRGDDALLVDGWVARALVVEPWQLQIRRPAADVDRFDLRITEAGHELAFHGHPRQRGDLWVDPVLTEALERALRELVIVGASAPPSPPDRLAIELVPNGARVTINGVCPGHPDEMVIGGSVRGCVTAASAQAVVSAAHALLQDRTVVADRRPLPIEAVSLDFNDGDERGSIALDKSPHVTLGKQIYPTDPIALAELFAALGTPGEIVPEPATPTVTRLSASSSYAMRTTTSPAKGGETVTLELHAPDIVVRTTDRITLRIGKGAWEILARAPMRYRDRTLWHEEPTTISGLVIDGTTWSRGDVIGEWRRAGGDSTPVPSVEALATGLARLSAIDAAPPADLAIAHRVKLVVTPPVGSPTSHELELGAPTATGCPIRADGHLWLAPREACKLVQALLSR